MKGDAECEVRNAESAIHNPNSESGDNPQSEIRSLQSEVRNPQSASRIIGVGVDIVKVKRIERAIEKWAGRFLRYVFTPAEIEYCRRYTVEGVHFAARFAAKEAVKKAVGEKFRWTDVEIINDGDGKPVVKLAGKNLRVNVEKLQVFLSMSHTDEHAIAYVIVQD